MKGSTRRVRDTVHELVSAYRESAHTRPRAVKCHNRAIGTEEGLVGHSEDITDAQVFCAHQHEGIHFTGGYSQAEEVCLRQHARHDVESVAVQTVREALDSFYFFDEAGTCNILASSSMMSPCKRERLMIVFFGKK